MTGSRIRTIGMPAGVALLLATGLTGWQPPGLTASKASAGARGIVLSQAEPGDNSVNDGTGKVDAQSGPRIIRPREADTPGDAGTSGKAGPQDATSAPDETPASDAPVIAQDGDPPYKTPEILTDLSALPFAARRMHELLVEAARSGDIEKLRPYIGAGDDVTMLSFGGVEGDPVEFLKSTSGDPEGHEILAILLEVLEAGYVHVEAGTPNEMYVWPYFYGVRLDTLTPRQRVELFTLLTYGDYQEMVSFGAYLFYRVGITPQGRWRFFVAGD